MRCGAQVTGRPVVVKLNTGVDYRGVLACLDGYMNIAMEQARVPLPSALHARPAHLRGPARSSVERERAWPAEE